MGQAIDSGRWVTLGGERQSIRIVSEDASNPVLLFIHGGPGVCDRHLVLKYQRALARDLTLVLWDQRCSGRSYTGRGAKKEVHIEDYVRDAQALVRLLCAMFRRESIFVAGHSWGTVIGAQLAAREPRRVAGYIGQGQFVNGARNEELSHRFCVEEARRLGDAKALRALEKGRPENGHYPSQRAMLVQRDCLTRYGGANYRERSGVVQSLVVPLLTTGEYTPAGKVGYVRGALRLMDALADEVIDCRLDETVRRLGVPVLMTIGRHDYNTPAELAREWFDALEAPRKEWVWFENSAHSPIFEEPEAWARAVRGFCLGASEK